MSLIENYVGHLRREADKAAALTDRRDMFAAAALTGMLAAFVGDVKFPTTKMAALQAYDFADAMMKESTARANPEATP